MNRTAAAKSLLSLAWALVRYATNVIRNDLAPSDKHDVAELRWKINCQNRWDKFRRARDDWRTSRVRS